MIIELKKFGFAGVFSLLATASYAETGNLFNIEQAGAAIAPTNVTVCANTVDASHPLNCQVVTIAQESFTVTPVNTGVTYI